MKMISRLKTLFHIKNNYSFITIGTFLFILNQILETIFLYYLNRDHLDLCRWDCGWYQTIVVNGYDSEPHEHEKMDAANWTFFPLFPLIAKVVVHITDLSPKISLILVSKIFFLLSIIAFIKFTQKYYPTIRPFIAGSIVAFSPYAIYGNTGYTESLFFFLTCLFFCLLKEKKYLQAGLVGAFLSATRFVGISAFLSYFIFTFYQERNKLTRETLLGWLIIPLGLSLFMIHLYNITGDALAFMHVHRAWNRTPDLPWNNIINGLLGNSLTKYWALISIFALISSLFLAYKKHYELSLFSFSCTLLSISNTSLYSCPRYIFWQAPILLVIAMISKYKPVFYIIIVLFLIGQYILYSGWFSGQSWVV